MKEVTVSKELFDRTFKEKCEWQDKYWKAYDELVKQDREIERLNNIIKKGITEEMKDELDLILKTNQKQAYRINKAIEYIENYLCSDEYIQSDINSIANAFVKLVDILKGVNKE